MTSLILPGKRSRDGLRTLDADVVPAQVEVGQWGIDLDVVGEQDGISGLQPPPFVARLLLIGLDAAKRLDLAVLLGRAYDVGSGLANVVNEQVD